MAKKKGRPAGTKNVVQSRVELPKGFKAIEHIGNYWRGEKPGDSITGKLVKSGTKHFPKGKYAARDANVYTLDVDGRKVEITQSGGLGALEQVKKGQMVYVQFLGMKKIKGKKESMREFLVAAK